MKCTPKVYSCSSCGAAAKYDPDSINLKCDFCGSSTEIEVEDATICEYKLEDDLNNPDAIVPNSEVKETNCKNCGSNFSMEQYESSTLCPHCATPIIVDFVNKIKPEAILPFTVSHKKAKSIFADWIGSLWLAPNELKHLVDTDKKMSGYYLPFWAFDTDTTTDYQGQRGDIYYVTVEKRVVEDGKEKIIQEQEERIDWNYASGRVSRRFDDLTVEANKKLPQNILSSLAPWNTKSTIAFDNRFLSGFISQEYSIPLKDGFDRAVGIMKREIEDDIETDIGGDRQQIDSMNTNYYDPKYKNLLLPIWTTHFKYKGKEYHYAINGDSGKITGDRPYSYTKVAILVGTIALVVAAGVYLWQSQKPTSTTNAVQYQQSVYR